MDSHRAGVKFMVMQIPVVSDSDNTDQNSLGGSKNCAGGPCVENPALVSSAARHVHRCSLSAPTERGPT